MVVGKVMELQKHPNAEKLNVAMVDIGIEQIQIVCGGVNLEKGQTVPVALIGAIMPNGMKIEPVNLRGVESNGMICAKEELNLGPNGPKEIMVLDSNLQAGTPLTEAFKMKGYTVPQLQELFTIRTAEVEAIEKPGEKLQNVVTGKIVAFEKIADSDKLHRATIDIGSKKIQLIFGSVHEVKTGWVVPIALPGAIMANGIMIKKTKIHGIESEGMIADDKELGIENTSEGLTIFPPKTALGMPIADALDLEDTIFIMDNKSLTHRPDLWGHYGIAREFSAILGTKIKPYEKAVQLAKEKDIPIIKSPLNITIVDKEICPRFTSCIIKNIKVEESPQWLKSDLVKVGIRPVNNIVDITNHIMLGLGQPMHAYDRKMVETDTLEVRYAKKGEFIETIDHKHHDLSEEDPIITNGKHVLTIAGVMGGAYSEISEHTTEIILESANWQPAVVRKASQRNGLRTEAVQRFEKSIDSEMAITGLLRAIALVKKLCPKAELEGGLVDDYSEKVATKVIVVRPERIQQKIGAIVTTNEMKDILKRLGFGVASAPNKSLSITVPSWRATKDIATEDDIVEEVARMHGYENIPTPLPTLPTKLPEENILRTLEHKSRTILSGLLNMNEVYNYSFYSGADLANALLPEELHLKPQNFLSTDQTHLRISLVPNILKNIHDNLRFKKSFSIYEIGHTYNEEHAFFPREDVWITGAIVTNTTENPNSIPLLDAKGIAETYMQNIGAPIQEWKKDGLTLQLAHPHNSLAMFSPSERLIARCYDLNPIITKKFDLEGPHKIAIFELNLSQLSQEKLLERKYQPIPRHPGIEFDLAILIDKKIPSIQLKKAIESAMPELIKYATLFDQYEGPNVDPSKKSLAYRILLQSDDRTLTEDDMTKAQKVIMENIAAIGGMLR